MGTVGHLGMAKAGKYESMLLKMLRETVASTSPPMLTPNCAAAMALGQLGVKGDVLVGYLKSKSPDMRATVCTSLANMGKAGVEHASAISLLLEDESMHVRSVALSALEKLQDAGSLESSIVAKIKDAKA